MNHMHEKEIYFREIFYSSAQEFSETINKKMQVPQSIK